MTQPSANAGAYLRTKVLTASPEELRLMLIEGAIRFARQGREGLIGKDFEASYTGFSKCRAIIIELINSMRPDVDPDLCAKMSGLYTFMFNHLVAGSHEKDVGKIDKVIELLEYDRETWTLLMRKVSAERAGATGATGTQADVETAGAGAGGTGRAPISIEG
jgi:flagellar protein FliS